MKREINKGHRQQVQLETRDRDSIRYNRFSRFFHLSLDFTDDCLSAHSTSGFDTSGRAKRRTDMLSMLLKGVSRVDHFKFLSSFPSGIKQDSFSSSGYTSVSSQRYWVRRTYGDLQGI